MNTISSESPHEEEIVIRGTSVAICIPNNGALYRATFNFEDDKQPIAQALFTHFSSSSSSTNETSPSESWAPSAKTDLTLAQPNTPAKALVVLLKTLIHVIYLDGGSYIVHLPFPVLRLWSIPLGLLIERQADSEQGPMAPDQSFANDESLPRLFTLSSPLEDFGMVTSNGTSLDSVEEIIFVSSQSDSILVTRNSRTNQITLWYATPDQQERRKVPSAYLFCTNEVTPLIPSSLLHQCKYP